MVPSELDLAHGEPDAVKSKTRPPAPSERLLAVLDGFHQVLVVMHDNPDPDAIASGWGIVYLIETKLSLHAQLIGGGDIIRAENRHMVKLLRPPMNLVSEIEVPPRTAAVLVDCGLGTANHLLDQENIRPMAVIDHHRTTKSSMHVPFEDIRPDVAASATIVASYLREQRVDPPGLLATALIYAMRSETRGSQTHHSRLDRSVLTWLTERADPSLLAEIESAPLSREYFPDLVLALQNTFTYDDAAFCLLPRASGPEIVGEVADLLIRCEGIRRVFCGAIVGEDLVVSARTERGGDDAAQLLRQTIEGLGQCGGHSHRAGGKIRGVGKQQKVGDNLQEELRGRWLGACDVNRQRGTRLVARRDIVENL